jgi:predicted transcriptional regulator
MIEAATEKGADMKVEDLMTRDVVSVSPETTLKEVAEKLVQYRISETARMRRRGQGRRRRLGGRHPLPRARARRA